MSSNFTAGSPSGAGVLTGRKNDANQPDTSNRGPNPSSNKDNIIPGIRFLFNDLAHQYS